MAERVALDVDGRLIVACLDSAYVYTRGFDLYIYRCPACGSRGRKGSWCKGHSAPVATHADSLDVRREPVLVPHALDDEDSPPTVTRLIYEGER